MIFANFSWKSFPVDKQLLPEIIIAYIHELSDVVYERIQLELQSLAGEEDHHHGDGLAGGGGQVQLDDGLAGEDDKLWPDTSLPLAVSVEVPLLSQRPHDPVQPPSVLH